MIKNFFQILLCMALTGLLGCAHHTGGPQDSSGAPARIQVRDRFDCFEPGLVTDKGKTVQCEASAAVFTGNALIVGSDKPVPGKSPVFALDYADSRLDPGTLRYLTAPPLVQAVKYEDFTLTPDGGYVIATTGFDRIRPDSHKWDAYNTLLSWPVNHPEAARVAGASTHDGITSSVGLRRKLSAALATRRYPSGMPYFKVEGLAAIPGNRLLFGIRELGARYDDFDYAVKLVAVSYHFEGDSLVLGEDFSLVYDYNPGVHPQLAHAVALSSIEYDRYQDRLYLLTSFEEDETDEGLGGYLWTLPLAAFAQGCAPTLVMQEGGTPLIFAHKAEGLAVLDAGRLLVVHDDDRVLGRESVQNVQTQFHRQPNQAAYSVVTFMP